MSVHAPIDALSAQSTGRPDGRPRTILLQRIVAEAQKRDAAMERRQKAETQRHYDTHPYARD